MSQTLTLGLFDDPLVYFDDPFVSFDAVPVLPVTKVQIALSDGPLVVNPTWTTITNTLQGMTTKRGRDHERNRMQAGTASFTFQNVDDKLNPWNSASSLYSGGDGLQPMRQMRVVETWSGVDYPLWRGHVEAFTPKWDSAVGAQMVITAVDAFKIFNLSLISSASYYDAVMATTPAAFYRLGDTGNNLVGSLQVAADSSGNGYDGIYKGSVSLGVNGATPTDPNMAADLGQSAGWVEVPNAAGPLSGTGDFTIEMWVFLRSWPAAGEFNHLWHTLLVGSQAIELFLRDDGTLRFRVTDGTDGGTVDSSFALLPGLWWHVAAVKEGTAGPSGWAIYLNAVNASTNPVVDGTGNVSVTANGALIGGYQSPANTSGIDVANLNGIIDEVAVYHHALNSTQVSDHYGANRLFSHALASGSRVGFLLDTINWPNGLRSLDSGGFAMASVLDPLYQTSALSYLLDVVDSEGYPAEAFMDAAGVFTFRDRSHGVGSVIATLGDAAGEMHYQLGGGTTPVRDDSDVWPTAVFQSQRGAAQTYTNSVAAGKYFNRTQTRTGLLNAFDSNVLTLATEFVSRYSTPKERLKAVTVLPYADPLTMYPVCLGAEIGQRFLVNRHRFPGGGSSLLLDVRVEGVQHDYAPGTDRPWTTTLQLAPT